MLSLLVIIFVVLGASAAVFFVWRAKVRAEIAEGAAISWSQYAETEPDFVADMSETEFHSIYSRVHMPRFPAYALGAFSAFLLSLPVIFAVLAAALWGAEAVGLTPEPVDVANRYFIRDGQLVLFQNAPPEAALYYIRDLGGFYYFFGVLVSWLVIVWGFTRHYHRNRPGYLRDEIIRAKESRGNS